MSASSSTAAAREASPPPPSKRQKPSTSTPAAFVASAISPETALLRRDEYRASGPYLHAVVDMLLQNSLLERVRDEVAMKEGDQEAGLGGLVGWGAKETDIYKVSLRLLALALRRRLCRACFHSKGSTTGRDGRWADGRAGRKVVLSSSLPPSLTSSSTPLASSTVPALGSKDLPSSSSSVSSDQPILRPRLPHSRTPPRSDSRQTPSSPRASRRSLFARIQRLGSSGHRVRSSLSTEGRRFRISLHQRVCFLPLFTFSSPASSPRPPSLHLSRCHLLLHDDVISTRRISWILYLPSESWTPAWGGALELYPSLQSNPSSVPLDPSKPATWKEEIGSDVFPGKTIHPKWGQFVFFEVMPGMSYHSVEEVIKGEGKERLSISGW